MYFDDPGVVLITKACHRVEPGLVDDAFDNCGIGNVNADDLSNYDVICATSILVR